MPVLTLVVTAAIFAYGLMCPVLGVLLPTYPLSPGQQGNLTLTNALGLVIASLAAGPLIEAFGKKLALSSGLTLIMLSLLLLPHSVAYSSLLAVYFALGIGGGIVTTGANSLVSGVSPGRRGPALNFVNIFFGLGGIVTTFAASYLLSAAALCDTIAAVAFAAMALNVAVTSPPASGSAGPRLDEVPRMLRNPILLLLALALFLDVGCEVGIWNWLKAYLMTRQFNASTAGGIVSYGFAFGMLAGRAAGTRVLRSFNAVNLMVWCSALTAISSLAMLQVSSQSAVTVLVFCIGFAMAPVFPTVLALVGDNFPRNTATAIGVTTTCGWLGSALASPLIGRAAAVTNLHTALFLLPCLGVALVLVTLVLHSKLFSLHSA